MKKPNIKRHEWRIEKIDGEYWIVTPLDTGDGMYRIATIHGADHNSLEDTAKAISAVPEMIDTLFDCRSNIIQSQKFHGTSGSKLLEKINKTLKKAGCHE